MRSALIFCWYCEICAGLSWWFRAELDSTRADWDKMLGKGETWVTGGRHTRAWVTQKAGKEWHGHYICRKRTIEEPEYPSFTLAKTFARGIYPTF